MRFRSIALATALVAAGSVSALAQTSTKVSITGTAPAGDSPVTSSPGSLPAGSYPAGTPNFYISPYAGVINVGTAQQTTVSLNCVDFFHHVSVPETWDAWITNLGQAGANVSPSSLLQYTRYGNLGGTSAYANTLTMYKQAAWLTLQYDADAGAAGSVNKTRAIQSAIWTLFNPRTTVAAAAAVTNAYDAYGFGGTAPWYKGPSVPVDNDDSSWWVVEAQKASNQLSAADMQYFYIITDNSYPWNDDSKQEFIIHVTPEPGTIVLMLTGMVALLIVMRRRRPAASGLESA